MGVEKWLFSGVQVRGQTRQALWAFLTLRLFLLPDKNCIRVVTANAAQTYRMSNANPEFLSDKGFSCSNKYLVNDFVSLYQFLTFCVLMVDLFSGVC